RTQEVWEQAQWPRSAAKAEPCLESLLGITWGLVPVAVGHNELPGQKVHR
ncbi:Hypothetical predicted protein, partial [Marmota monax]